MYVCMYVCISLDLGTCKLCQHSFGHNGLNLNDEGIFTSRGWQILSSFVLTAELE